ncbi:MAG TPA: hypothetical protein PLE30_00740 [Candidatus Kapabacteria bacterium]|nr:hypothetical protein [Candidatus Kapabacteria bacterium]
MKLLIIYLFFSCTLIYAQEKGGATPFSPDSVIIFESPRPLISSQDNLQSPPGGWGAEITLSDSGFGAGLFIHTFLSKSLLLHTSLYLSGARNSDEFEELMVDKEGFYVWQVKNKINRLYKFPLMVSLQYFMFQDEISESFQPYVALGGGPTFILSAPYTYNRMPNGEIMGWFKSFSYADFYTKLGAYIGVGSYFGSFKGNILGVNIKYYYVPFGDKGLESVLGLPIQNFGGVFLSLSVGTSF